MPLTAAVVLSVCALVQALALHLRARWRARFDLRVRDLYRDVYLPPQEWRRIEFYRRASRGGRATLRRWARVPGRMLRVEGPARDPGEENPDHPLPVGLKVVHDLAARLEWAAHPFAFALTVALGLPVLLVGQAIGLARGARPRLSLRTIRWAAEGDLLLGARAARDLRLTRSELMAIGPLPRHAHGGETRSRICLNLFG